MKSNLIEPPKGKQTAGDAKEKCGQPQDVAPTRQFDSVPQERHQAAASPVASNELITEQASTTERERQELFGQLCKGYYHWGLNE
jgi:hypothetical protein